MTTNQKILIEIKKRGYTITNEGKLFNPKGKEIKGSISKPAGYRQVALRMLGHSSYKLMFHRIQAFKKYGNNMFEKGIEVRHLNGDKLDNSFDNISIGTHSENMMDVPEKIRRFSKSKYNHTKVLKLLKLGVSPKEINNKLGIPLGSINWIKNYSVESKK